MNEQEAFNIWVDGQSTERLQIARHRAIKRFDSQYYRFSELEDYFEDEDFMEILTDEINKLWINDIMWDLNRDGVISLEVAEDGSLYGIELAHA